MLDIIRCQFKCFDHYVRGLDVSGAEKFGWQAFNAVVA